MSKYREYRPIPVTVKTLLVIFKTVIGPYWLLLERLPVHTDYR
jgi:hypothetical protein